MVLGGGDVQVYVGWYYSMPMPTRRIAVATGRITVAPGISASAIIDVNDSHHSGVRAAAGTIATTAIASAAATATAAKLFQQAA